MVTFPEKWTKGDPKESLSSTKIKEEKVEFEEWVKETIKIEPCATRVEYLGTKTKIVRMISQNPSKEWKKATKTWFRSLWTEIDADYTGTLFSATDASTDTSDQ